MNTQEPVIVIDKLEKSYGKIQAVRGISISVERGEIFGFLGPNGAGKTTTIRCMLDVIRPSAGTIRVLGIDAQRDKLALHKHIGYLPGEVRLPGQMTGKQVIDYFSRLQGLEPVLLNDLIARFDVEVKRPMKSYSKGMRQKIGIVLAFMCDPEVLILDEPTSGLDPLLQKTFHEVLLEEQARGKTIFMSSHIMSDVEKVCQRVAVIRSGELVTIEEVEKLREKAGQRVIVEFGDTVTEEAVARFNYYGEDDHQCKNANDNGLFLWGIDCLTGGCNLPDSVSSQRGSISVLRYCIRSRRGTSHQFFKLYSNPGT